MIVFVTLVDVCLVTMFFGGFREAPCMDCLDSDREMFGWVLRHIRDRLYVLRREALRNPSGESVGALRDYLVWVREELDI
jgi:hypothetical protein